MLQIVRYSPFWVTMALVCGCSSEQSPELIFEDVTVVSETPYDVHVGETQKIELATIGCTDFTVKNDKLLVTTSNKEGLVDVYNWPEMEFKGSFIQIGNGPLEVYNQLFTNDFSYYTQDDDLHVNFYDGYTSAIDWNVDESVRNQKISMVKSKINLPVEDGGVISYSYLGGNDCLYRHISDDATSQIRVLSLAGGESSNEYIDHLNSVSIPKIKDSFLFNIMSTYTRVNKERNLVVEVPLFMNHINIYGIRGKSFAKSIRIGEKVESVKKLFNEGATGMQLVFYDARAYDDFFGVVYKDKYDLKALPVIYFFNWDGDPLCSVKMDRNINFFDIDFVHEKLLVFDSTTESLFACDFRLPNN